ncbi:hypothetical protein SAMN05446635_6035 [Burkholderia sp. OK233]|nr:hypothetical protein SAMN05446635_6035 [Burkholderia sp. OK233]
MTSRSSLVGKAVSEFLAWWPVAAVLAFSGIVTIVTGWHDFTDKVGHTLPASSGTAVPVPASGPVRPASPVGTQAVPGARGSATVF